MTEETLAQLQKQERYRDLSRKELVQLADLTVRLRKISLFDSLSDEDLAYIAEAGELRHFESGQTVIREGDTDKILYVVLRGQVRVWTEAEGGQRRLLNYHRAGDFFGELCFRNGGRRTANVDVVDDADLLAFEREGYNRIIQHSEIAEYLENWSQERMQRSNQPFEGKQWDEISVVHARKSWVALAMEVVFPVGIVLIYLAVWLLLSRFTRTSGACMTSLFVALAVAMGLWILAMWEDWRNDDFIVTSKRIIHVERVFIPPFPIERHEAPIAQVTDIKALGYTLLTWLFGVQKLVISTEATGTIEFPYLQDAEQIREAIFRARQMALERRTITERTRIRQELSKVLDQRPPEITPIENGERVQVTPERRGLLKLLDYFVPYSRIVMADRILWRRHWLTLVSAVFLPMLLMALALFLLILGIARPGFVGELPAWLTVGAPTALFVFAIAWYLWRYDGWRNDYYVVTDTRIIDVEGSPFHLRQESRVEGTFDIIQNTYYTSRNWIARIFRIGDVIIDTAAQQAAFTFHDVARPEQVQQQIFERLTSFRERRTQQVADQRYAEFARWFDTYHRSVVEQKE